MRSAAPPTTGPAPVVASDHVVPVPEDFIAVCREATAAAGEGWIVTFGMQPRSAATGYGYIRPGKQLNGATVWTVEAFTEKPDTDNAERYLAEGYLWNSGNFLFRADTMLEEVSRFEARAAKLAVDGQHRQHRCNRRCSFWTLARAVSLR